MTTLDFAVLAAYFVLIFGIGFSFARRNRSSTEYFLADRNVGWFAIGTSLFATNISSEHFIGLAGSGATTGLAVGHFEWLAVFMVLTLGWVFTPFYLRSAVFTMPEFLERRYGPACRWYLTTVSVLAYIFTKISVSLYAGALLLETLLGWDFYTSAVVMVVPPACTRWLAAWRRSSTPNWCRRSSCSPARSSSRCSASTRSAAGARCARRCRPTSSR